MVDLSALPLPPSNRNDSTPEAGNHALDHNQAATALAALRDAVVDMPTTLGPTFARGVRIAPGLNGVVGDGVTDDTAAIQARLNTVTAKGAVDLAEGTYIISTLLLNQDGISIRGAGRGRTVLKVKTGSTLDAITINNEAGYKSNGITIEGLSIVGATGSGHGIKATRVSGLTLRDVRVESHGGDGVRTNDVTGFSWIGGGALNNGGNGVSGGYKHDSGAYVSVGFYGNAGYGVALDYDLSGRANGNAFNGCAFNLNALGALWVRGASTNGTVLNGCYIERNGTSRQVQIGETTTGNAPTSVTFTGCYFNGAGVAAYGIEAYEAQAFKAEDCFFENHTAGAIKLNNPTALWVERSSNAAGNGVLDSLGTNHSFDSGRSLVFSGASSGPGYIPSAVGIVPLFIRPVTGQTADLFQIRNAAATGTTFKVRADGYLTVGTMAPSGTADLNIARDDALATQLLRVERGASAGSGAMAQFDTAASSAFTGTVLYARTRGAAASNAFVAGDATGNTFVVQSGGKIGFYGVTPVTRAAVAAAATDATTTQALANDLRAKLVALGLVS